MGPMGPKYIIRNMAEHNAWGTGPMGPDTQIHIQKYKCSEPDIHNTCLFTKGTQFLARAPSPIPEIVTMGRLGDHRREHILRGR